MWARAWKITVLMERIWSDHTDVRPTILSLVGLKDDYVHDGRVVTEALEVFAVPTSGETKAWALKC